MDVYAKRKGGWIQVASHTVIDPEWRAEQASKPMPVGPKIRQFILDQREKVWRAWFANDRATLEKLIPEEVIAIDSGGEGWSNRAEVFAGAQRFADGWEAAAARVSEDGGPGLRQYGAGVHGLRLRNGDQ